MNEQGLNSIIGTLVMLSRYEIDASNKGGAVWLITPEDEDNMNIIGQQVMKIPMPHAMFDQQKARVDANEFNLPCQAEVFYKTVMGGGNKPVMKAVSIRPLINNKAVEDKENKSVENKPQPKQN